MKIYIVQNDEEGIYEVVSSEKKAKILTNELNEEKIKEAKEDDIDATSPERGYEYSYIGHHVC